MRLSTEVKNQIVTYAQYHFGDAIKLYLFGSRVYDNKKGGDIDILIYSEKNSLKLSQEVSRKFVMELDSKLDVVVFDKNNMTKEQKAFVNTLEMIRLK